MRTAQILVILAGCVLLTEAIYLVETKDSEDEYCVDRFPDRCENEKNKRDVDFEQFCSIASSDCPKSCGLCTDVVEKRNQVHTLGECLDGHPVTCHNQSRDLTELAFLEFCEVYGSSCKHSCNLCAEGCIGNPCHNGGVCTEHEELKTEYSCACKGTGHRGLTCNVFVADLVKVVPSNDTTVFNWKKKTGEGGPEDQLPKSTDVHSQGGANGATLDKVMKKANIKISSLQKDVEKFEIEKRALSEELEASIKMNKDLLAHLGQIADIATGKVTDEDSDECADIHPRNCKALIGGMENFCDTYAFECRETCGICEDQTEKDFDIFSN